MYQSNMKLDIDIKRTGRHLNTATNVYIIMELPVDFISNRYKNKEINRIHPGLSDNDLYFPDWFVGKWNVSSYLRNVEAPIDIETFGGRVITERLYNVEQIAMAAMGENSIIDDYQPGYDITKNIRLVLASPVSKSVQYEVNLESTDRQQIPLSNNPALKSSPYFSLLEISTQSLQVSNSTSGYISPFLKKDIETITLYTKLSDNKIKALQRTATYLCPSDLRYSENVKRQPKVVVDPIDIRCYEVIYDKII
eukprot:gene17399-22948_t